MHAALTSTEEELEEEENDFEGKSSISILFIGLNPINPEEWKEANMFMKFLTILQVNHFLFYGNPV